MVMTPEEFFNTGFYLTVREVNSFISKHTGRAASDSRPPNDGGASTLKSAQMHRREKS